MPNGYRIPPHFHPGYEHVEVGKGTLLVGMADKVDPKRTRTLSTGDSATARRGCNGPFTITYLRAEDAPRRRVFPFGY